LSKKTTKVIITSGNNYLIGVKANQPKLYEQIQANTSETEKIQSSYSELELNKGRLERREVFVSNNLTGIAKDWKGIKQIIKVKRWTKRKQKESFETAYFISSKEYPATIYSYGIRGHWGIENGLHWVKDVTFKEDASKIRTCQAPQNISIFRNLAINLFRGNGYHNMAEAIRLNCNHITQLCQMIL